MSYVLTAHTRVEAIRILDSRFDAPTGHPAYVNPIRLRKRIGDGSLLVCDNADYGLVSYTMMYCFDTIAKGHTNLTLWVENGNMAQLWDEEAIRCIGSIDDALRFCDVPAFTLTHPAQTFDYFYDLAIANAPVARFHALCTICQCAQLDAILFSYEGDRWLELREGSMFLHARDEKVLKEAREYFAKQA